MLFTERSKLKIPVSILGGKNCSQEGGGDYSLKMNMKMNMKMKKVCAKR